LGARPLCYRQRVRRGAGKVLRDLERELRRLEEDRNRLDREIARLRQAAEWLRGSVRGAAPPQSLTTACRVALRSAPPRLTAREVRDALNRDGFDWKAFTSPMSAVHTVLKRLVAQGEATPFVDERGDRRIAWKRDGWQGHTRTQVEEADRIAHLLDGAVSETEFKAIVAPWRAAYYGRRPK